MKKTIMVCGDLVLDHDLARLPGRARNYQAPCPPTLLSRRHGGAWYVEEMIRVAIGQVSDSPTVIAPRRLPRNSSMSTWAVARAFSVWDYFKNEKGRKDGKGTWRIDQFLGCEHPAADLEVKPVPLTSASASPDVLVIDDLGLGFAEKEKLWPEALSAKKPPAAVVIKGSAPFDLLLWSKLLKPPWAQHVTVVVTARTLREIGARLSRALSWDQAIEDLQEEFSHGASARIFQACKRVIVGFGAEGAGVFSRLPRSPREPQWAQQLHFDQFIYDPMALEGMWRYRFPGHTFGALSVLSAAVARHELDGQDSPLFIALCRALAGVRALHEAGAGQDEKTLDMLAAMPSLETLFQPFQDRKNTGGAHLPEDRFRAAYPRELVEKSALPCASLGRPCLLTDVTGDSLEFLAAKAEEVVLRGVDAALAAVPRACYGNYVTVDREEIERINSVRNLILDYQRTSDPKPLSLAVFGPPGAGKSFAIKQLAKQLFSGSDAMVEFNLSQFESLHDLHEAFHKVCDLSLQGQIPLVFWDEFDAALGGKWLGWLKEFLAPMQDARFQAGGASHPLGKAIFIFAGGTAPTFADFAQRPPDENQKFRDAKGPDFVSRLRGYVNIKGPNPVVLGADPMYLIRRAVLLRALIERDFRDAIIDPDTKEARVSPGVLSGLLRVKGYKHGARSMEAVVGLSHLRNSRRFGLSELPAWELIDLHLSDDFAQKAAAAEALAVPLKDFVETLAREMHEIFRRTREAQGWGYGEVRDDKRKMHPLMKPYEELDAAGKERNLAPARLALTRLAAFNYEIRPARGRSGGGVQKFSVKEKEALAICEHQRWMREQLVEGYVYGPTQDDKHRVHADLQFLHSLSRSEQQVDHKLIAAILKVLPRLGLVMIRRTTAKPR